MDGFVFLNPIDEHFDYELRGTAAFMPENPVYVKRRRAQLEAARTKKDHVAYRELRTKITEENLPLWTLIYKETLNAAIRARYRARGARVGFTVFSDTPVASIIDLHPQDRVIDVGMTRSEHQTLLPNGAHTYPDEDHIIDAMDAQRLYVGGFHSTDCVVRVAARALERGLDVIVDHELTNHFHRYLRHQDFSVDRRPETLEPWVLRWAREYGFSV